MKVLIVKPTALGDVAQACLLVPEIKKAYPQSFVGWIVDEDFKEIVKLCRGVDEVIGFPRKRWRKHFRPAEIVRWTKELKQKNYEVVLDLQGLARSGLMTRFSGAKRRIGMKSAREFSRFAYTEIVEDEDLYAIDRYKRIIHYFTKQSHPVAPEYLETPEPPGWNLKSRQYTVLHPYSQWETKLWPWEKYGELARKLKSESFVMVGKGADFPVCEENVIDLREKTNMRELLSVLGHAKAVISTDSGPAHLAAAFGRPVVTLFGASDPKKTAPYGNCTSVLVGQVACRPCLKRECRYTEPMKCLREISVEKVIDQWCQLTFDQE